MVRNRGGLLCKTSHLLTFVAKCHCEMSPGSLDRKYEDSDFIEQLIWYSGRVALAQARFNGPHPSGFVKR